MQGFLPGHGSWQPMDFKLRTPFSENASLLFSSRISSSSCCTSKALGNKCYILLLWLPSSLFLSVCRIEWWPAPEFTWSGGLSVRGQKRWGRERVQEWAKHWGFLPWCSLPFSPSRCLPGFPRPRGSSWFLCRTGSLPSPHVFHSFIGLNGELCNICKPFSVSSSLYSVLRYKFPSWHPQLCWKRNSTE